jgi:putative NADH-flavin reductase
MSAAPMRVLVVGSTGGTGRQLVAQALERGHRVTAFARRPERVGVTHERLEVRQGDVLDPESVAAAVAGQDAVVCALGHKRWFRPTRILSRGTENLIAAMRRHGVERLICETSLGVGGSFGRLGVYYTLFVVPVILQFYYWDKHRQEKAIRASGLRWTIVRPGALTNGRRRDAYRHGERVGSFLLTLRISRADTAAFLLDQLESEAYLYRAPGVANVPRWLPI